MLENNTATTSTAPAFFSSKPGLTLNTLGIALDIDDTLVSIAYPYPGMDKLNSYYNFIRSNHPDQIIPITCNGITFEHVLLPGVLEAIKYLLNAGCHLAFYSAGTEERNEKFKQAILSRLYPTDDLAKNANKIKIFSRDHHIVKSKPEDEPNLLIPLRDQKKDLKIIMDGFNESGVNFSLNNVILIDDDFSWMLKGQEKNFLKVPGCNQLDIQGAPINIFRINHIFYAIGLLDTILKYQNPLDVLFKLQFIDNDPTFHLLYYNYSLMADMQYYQLGLNVLRTVNKDLHMVDDKIFNQTSVLKVS